MKISNIGNAYFFNSAKNYGINTVSNPFAVNQEDVFEKKSNMSFKGLFFTDLFTDIYLNMCKNMFSVRNHYIKEMAISQLIETASDKRMQQWLLLNKNTKISNIIGQMYGNNSLLKTDFIVELFENAGISNSFALNRFLQTYSGNSETKKAFFGQEYEAVEVYGMLRNKEDMTRFPELLVYLHNYNESQDSENRVDINGVIDFLKQIGLSNFKDFDKKFAHLSSEFNDFESISDKYEAIKYLQETYQSKIEFLSDITQNNAALRKAKPQKIYAEQNDIIDYLYEENGGKSLDPLPSMIENVSASNKITSHTMKAMSSYFNGFATAEDKVNFYDLLRDADVSVQDLNVLTSRAVIADSDILNHIFNKDFFVKEISSVSGFDYNSAYSQYKNFKDVYNALYSADRVDSDEIKKITNITREFGLKNSFSMLELYNSFYGLKKKSITSDEFIQFLDSMVACPSKDILRQAKAEKKLPARILEQEREAFRSVEERIKKYILSDTTGYFIGKTPEEIYSEYKSSIGSGIEIESILQNISEFNITGNDEYSGKTQRIAELEQYFSDRRIFLEFINSNNIKFDFSPEDEKNIDNCIKLFSLLKKTEHVEYYTESGFIAESKSLLEEFFESYPDPDTQQEILSVIAEKNIRSLSVLNNFIRKYSGKDAQSDNILKHLQTLPHDVDFDQYCKILMLIQKKLDELNIPLNINNDNILSIDIDYFKSKNKIPSSAVIYLLNSIYKTEEGEIFISKLSEGLISRKNSYSKFQIAKEFTDRVNKTDESYTNLMQKLGLDKKTLELEDNCSDYLYIKAVEQALPDEFVSFVNSNDWLEIDKDKVPNLSLHARLRLIDRFALSKNNSIESLYSEETVNSLKAMIKAIYNDTPDSIRGSDRTKRIIIDTRYGNDIIETVFSRHGKMITIVPKSA